MTADESANTSETTAPTASGDEGLTPDNARQTVKTAASVVKGADELVDVEAYFHPDTAPILKDLYTWEHFKIENHYKSYDYETLEGTEPRIGGDFDRNEHLNFTDEFTEEWVGEVKHTISELHSEIDERTVNVPDDYDEDEFFTTPNGTKSVVSRYDLEKEVPDDKKPTYREVDRYWVNEPFSFVVIFHSTKENEKKYYAIEPYLTDIEKSVRDYLIAKLRKNIKYSRDNEVADSDDIISRAEVIEDNTEGLIERYGIDVKSDDSNSVILSMAKQLGLPVAGDSVRNMTFTDGVEDWSDFIDYVKEELLAESDPEIIESGEREWIYTPPEQLPDLHGTSVRPEPTVIAEDKDELTEFQVQKFLYYMKRNFVGYQRIDPIKHDINVEDISCDGYNQPVFVYHGDYEQIISNIYHGKEELDNFVTKLAQRSGKGISKRSPQVDATLPDGSRAQLTLGDEVSDHGTNYTIRQFKDVPFTPIDLINWRTFALDQMAFLWLCIENHKSLIFAGGTASGKTTSLNAVSLFIPSGAKIVSIEDTREVELPQRNWIASVTRPSFSDDDEGDVDEFDLLEAALRQRPDYIVMGEIRGEEGRTLFQVMSTGHTTYTTFHADSVDEVLKRFTTEPINVSKTMFTALDLVSIQTQTRVQGSKVRRNKTLTEVNEYDAENHEISVKDVYQWQAETDQFIPMPGADILDDIKFDRGWNDRKIELELLKRRTVLAYLIKKGLNEYAEVAATAQAFIQDPDTILKLIAQDRLEEALDDLREMESVQIDIAQEDEDMVPRPDPDQEMKQEIEGVLDEAEDKIFSDMDTDTNISLERILSGEPEDTTDSEDESDQDEEAVESVDELPDDDLPDFLSGGDEEDTDDFDFDDADDFDFDDGDDDDDDDDGGTEDDFDFDEGSTSGDDGFDFEEDSDDVEFDVGEEPDADDEEEDFDFGNDSSSDSTDTSSSGDIDDVFGDIEKVAAEEEDGEDDTSSTTSDETESDTPDSESKNESQATDMSDADSDDVFDEDTESEDGGLFDNEESENPLKQSSPGLSAPDTEAEYRPPDEVGAGSVSKDEDEDSLFGDDSSSSDDDGDLFGGSSDSESSSDSVFGDDNDEEDDDEDDSDSLFGDDNDEDDDEDDSDSLFGGD